MAIPSIPNGSVEMKLNQTADIQKMLIFFLYSLTGIDIDLLKLNILNYLHICKTAKR